MNWTPPLMRWRWLEVESALLAVTLAALMMPLKLELGAVGVAAFMGPLFALVMMGVARVGWRQIGRSLARWEWVLLAFGLWVALGAALRPNSDRAAVMMLLGALPLAIYVRRAWGTTVNSTFLTRFMIAAAAVQVSVCALQLATFSSIGNVQAYFGKTESTEALLVQGGRLLRLVGTLGMTNAVGTWLAMSSAFVFAEMAHPARSRGQSLGRQMGLLGLWVGGAAATLIAVSRANIAALFTVPMVLVGLWWMRGQTRPRGVVGTASVRRWALGALLLAVVLLLPWEQSATVQRFLEGADQRWSDTERALAPRMRLAAETASVVQARPLLGAGFGRTGITWRGLNGDRAEARRLRPHNLWLLIAADCGLPAVMLLALVFALPIVPAVWAPGRMGWEATVLVAALTAYLWASMFYFHPITPAMWPLALVLLAALDAVVNEARVSAGAGSIPRAISGALPGAFPGALPGAGAGA
jgi:hypothetical protein